MPFNEFHYTPMGTGVISGKEVLEQTEDAINDLGTQISGDVQTAIDTANNALNTANTASADAQNAVNTANTAYTTATNAQNTANAAQNTANNALTAAQSAQNDVNALGNRVTTAENNITQNTTDISGLTTRMGTAEGNITTLQNDVVTAQGTATSAQNTATMARQQAYVLRYSSTAITDNSTIAYSTLDNTDNIKATDKIIDVDGKLFEITAVDTTNQTVTVGSALIDIALDGNVIHNSGDETISGFKTFNNGARIYKSNSLENTPSLVFRTSKVSRGSTTDGGDSQSIMFNDRGDLLLSSVRCTKVSNGTTQLRNIVNTTDTSDNVIVCETQLNISKNGDKSFVSAEDAQINLGSISARWKGVYAQSYYYGNNNVEFSTKFVTTDTNQTIAGQKVFTDNFYIYNSDVNSATPKLSLKSALFEKGDTENTDNIQIQFLDKYSNYVGSINGSKNTAGTQYLQLSVRTTDADNNNISSTINYYLSKNGDRAFTPYEDGLINLGTSQRKWKNTYTNLVNDITPSSLSLPNFSSGSIDISGYIQYLDSSTNTYTPIVNGWILLSVDNSSASNYIRCVVNNYPIAKVHGNGQGSGLCVMFPVNANLQVSIKIIANTLSNAYFFPCQGNI